MALEVESVLEAADVHACEVEASYMPCVYWKQLIKDDERQYTKHYRTTHWQHNTPTHLVDGLSATQLVYAAFCIGYW